jgi:hypothetical protein
MSNKLSANFPFPSKKKNFLRDYAGADAKYRAKSDCTMNSELDRTPYNRNITDKRRTMSQFRSSTPINQQQ